ncbi:hypothetical protein OUZ56_013288 [Daphnia magna]|uniref:Uncharacterized protein n=1 Tax=Daphnia magna TaxID=35525 RepID=A0ABQ9Z5J0_9CRUS|nr:hypothetical protein OUZ56_013288 [Daphnia magna]
MRKNWFIRSDHRQGRPTSEKAEDNVATVRVRAPPCDALLYRDFAYASKRCEHASTICGPSGHLSVS